jgi:hypothetical protein
MKKTVLISGICLLVAQLQAQIIDPQITSWLYNTTGQTFTGTNGTFTVNVNAIYYTSSNVYIKSSGVPYYYTDGNSNFDADDQSAIYKFPRTQTAATSATRSGGVAYANVGATLDGVLVLNPSDGKSYQNQDVWHQIAYSFEGLDFDSYNGHSTPQGVYHHHIDPNAMYNVSASTVHSPIVGYAFDGYPIYGPYAYTNTDGTGAITRMESSWQVRNISSRTTLPDGSTASSAGPCVGMPPSCQPLGKYWEDYEYVAGSGDLDRYNGRFCVTPEYPSGTYCYFVTLTSSLTPEFPYIIGDSLYGVASGSNNGIIPGGATQYTPAVGVKEAFDKISIKVFPNPVVDLLNITATENKKYRIHLYDATGTMLQKTTFTGSFALDMKAHACGVYVVEVIDEETGNGYLQKILK